MLGNVQNLPKYSKYAKHAVYVEYVVYAECTEYAKCARITIFAKICNTKRTNPYMQTQTSQTNKNFSRQFTKLNPQTYQTKPIIQTNMDLFLLISVFVTICVMCQGLHGFTERLRDF